MYEMACSNMIFNSHILCCMLLFADYINSEVFTAVVKLQRLAEAEEAMIEDLSVYVSESMREEAGKHVPDDVISFLTHFRAEDRAAVGPRYAENPLNAFHLVHRVYHDWNTVLQAVNCDQCSHTPAARNLHASVERLYADPAGPMAVTEADCRGTAVAIVRLWRTYNLDIKALISGVILDTRTSQLTTEDVLYICAVLDDRRQYYSEITWLRALHEMLLEKTFPDIATEARVVRAASSAYFKYGMPWESVRLLDEHLISDPDNRDITEDRDYFQTKLDNVDEAVSRRTLTPPREDLTLAHYESLCRGEGTRSFPKVNKLRCFSTPTAIPIIRGKEEVLNYNPRVAMYYDVISDAEQAFFKHQVIQKLARSSIVGSEGQVVDDTSMRVSQTAWLGGSVDPVIARLANRVELFTGLSTQELPKLSHAEPFQVLNYGVGGMYEAHYDLLGRALDDLDRESTRGSGERIATWMFYINHVKAGGGTVFVDLNITVPVVKGAAAFWYNIKRNGDLDLRTRHAGCPVLLGSKWVANKWIREDPQCFRRPCGLSPRSLDGLLPT